MIAISSTRTEPAGYSLAGRAWVRRIIDVCGLGFAAVTPSIRRAQRGGHIPDGDLFGRDHLALVKEYVDALTTAVFFGGAIYGFALAFPLGFLGHAVPVPALRWLLHTATGTTALVVPAAGFVMFGWHWRYRRILTKAPHRKLMPQQLPALLWRGSQLAWLLAATASVIIMLVDP